MFFKNKQLKILFSNTVMLYLMQASGYIFPMLTFPYLTRILGPEKYGIMVFVNAAMGYFQLLVDFGFLLSATKEISIHRDYTFKVGGILSSIIQAKLFLSIIGFFIVILMSEYIQDFSDKKTFLFLSYIPIVLSIMIPDYLFRGLERMNIIALVIVVSKTVYTILIFIIIKKSTDYIFIPIINSIGSLSIIIIIWYIIVNKYQITFRIMGIKDTISAMQESSIYFLSRIASSVYGFSNTFILGFKYESGMLAQYGVANSLNSMTKGIFSPIADSLYPYMVNKKNYILVRTLLVFSIPIILIFAIILYYYSDNIIMILAGSKFIGAAPIFRAMLPMVIITLPIYVLGFPVLGAMGKVKEANMSVIYASILHLLGLLGLFIFSSFNFINVVILTCVSEFSILLLRVFYIARCLNYGRGSK